jgi:Domain of unknown function (DUF5664)
MSNVGFKKIDTAETAYEGGAHRDKRRGKGALHWVPWDAMFLVSRIYEEGNIGRSDDGTGNDRNWENGMPLQDLVQSALNHLTAYLAGDRSEPHLPQAAWNTLNAIAMSIWVYMGWRPANLNRCVNQRGGYPNDPPPCPLSQQEIDWLAVRGIKRDEHNTVKEVAASRTGPLC